MSKKDQIILLNRYKETLNYLKRFEEKQTEKEHEHQKVKVLTRMRNGKIYKVS